MFYEIVPSNHLRVYSDYLKRKPGECSQVSVILANWLLHEALKPFFIHCSTCQMHGDSIIKTLHPFPMATSVIRSWYLNLVDRNHCWKLFLFFFQVHKDQISIMQGRQNIHHKFLAAAASKAIFYFYSMTSCFFGSPLTPGQ